MSNLEKLLLLQKKYDIPYLEGLTRKEIEALYDTEFYIEDN